MYNYKEIIETAFEEPTQDNQNLMIEAMVSFYQETRAKLESNDPAAKEDGARELLEIKTLLERKSNELCEKMGLNPSQLSILSDRFCPEETHLAIAQANERITSYKTTKASV